MYKLGKSELGYISDEDFEKLSEIFSNPYLNSKEVNEYIGGYIYDYADNLMSNTNSREEADKMLSNAINITDDFFDSMKSNSDKLDDLLQFGCDCTNERQLRNSIDKDIINTQIFFMSDDKKKSLVDDFITAIFLKSVKIMQMELEECYSENW